jgi:hypothetical protein
MLAINDENSVCQNLEFQVIRGCLDPFGDYG